MLFEVDTFHDLFEVNYPQKPKNYYPIENPDHDDLLQTLISRFNVGALNPVVRAGPVSLAISCQQKNNLWLTFVLNYPKDRLPVALQGHVVGSATRNRDLTNQMGLMLNKMVEQTPAWMSTLFVLHLRLNYSAAPYDISSNDSEYLRRQLSELGKMSRLTRERATSLLNNNLVITADIAEALVQ